MNSHYQDPAAALKYLDFLNSKNGQIQKLALFGAIKQSLPKDTQIAILDYGCGSGWLSQELLKTYKNIKGCDAAEFLIRFAQTHAKGVEFKVLSLGEPFPYAENAFDVVILNMVGPDLENLHSAFKNISAVLKPNGKLIMTVPNPKYTYPAAVWKRGVLGHLRLQKPKLIIKTPPAAGTKIKREFNKNSVIESYYYTLENYTDSAAKAELKLIETKEIKEHSHSKKFDLNYQLQKYPLLLLLEFSKQ